MDANFILLAKLQNRQNFGERDDYAFRALYGKEHPGRLTCYGRSLTKSFLRKEE